MPVITAHAAATQRERRATTRVLTKCARTPQREPRANDTDPMWAKLGLPAADGVDVATVTHPLIRHAASARRRHQLSTMWGKGASLRDL